MRQKRIQHWIERISRHIQPIIELDEDNEYRESEKDDVIRVYDSNNCRIRYLRDKRGFIDSDSDKSIDENVFNVSDNDVNDQN